MVRRQRNQTENKKIDLTSSISIITLDSKGQNTLMKRQTLAKCMYKNHDLRLCCLQETNMKYKKLG